MEKLMMIAGKRVILNMQYSEIGYGYPRLFIEITDESYINFDVSLDAVFNMNKEDFEDWLKDAVEIPEAEYKQVLFDNGMDYEKLKEALGKILNEEVK